MEQEEVWNAIAEKWSEFRTRPVEEVVDFLEDKKGKVLDLGCGSGRNGPSDRLQDLEFYGVDFSEKLLDIAKGKGYVEVKKGVTWEIPYEDEFFDYVMFVRALHCVEGEERRWKSLEEVYRVLRSGGEAMISVWSRGSGRVKNREKESFVPWTVDGKKVERYTYVYDRDELVKELEEVGFEAVRVEEGKNIVVVVRKR